MAALLCSGLSAAGVLPAGLIMSGGSRLGAEYAVGAAVAGAAYCAVFLLLAVVTRNAVVVGLVYALLWETTVAGWYPARRRSASGNGRSRSRRGWSTIRPSPRP